MSDPNNPYDPIDQSGNPSGWTPPSPGYGTPYGQPTPSDAYGYAPSPAPFAGQPQGFMPVPHPEATKILVFGILGLACCQIFGPIAWVMGDRVLGEIDANPMAYSNRTEAHIGRILGMVTSAILALVIVLYGGFFVLALIFPSILDS